jgi:16S rRNA processing protein RimM
VMVPFTRAVVPVVDLDAGRLVLDPPPGLLEPSKEDPLPPGEATSTSSPESPPPAVEKERA